MQNAHSYDNFPEECVWMAQRANVPRFLISPCIERGDGTGPVVDLGALAGSLLRITLGINDVLEQEGLTVSVWGSSSGTDWGNAPLLTLPQKSYCGEYHTFLNLENRPAVRFLRVDWKIGRWAKREAALMFGFYVAVEEASSHVTAAVA
jgi:hypothetical protein